MLVKINYYNLSALINSDLISMKVTLFVTAAAWMAINSLSNAINLKYSNELENFAQVDDQVDDLPVFFAQ